MKRTALWCFSSGERVPAGRVLDLRGIGLRSHFSSLLDFINIFGSTVWGLAYEPAACRIFRWQRGKAIVPGASAPLDPDKVFELRLFGPRWEVRWLRDGTKGRLAILTDHESTGKRLMTGANRIGLRGDRLATEPFFRDHGYLLWGEFESRQRHASKLTSARIGPLMVPWTSPSLSRNDRIVIRAREYFRIAEDGNVVFYDERLLGFARYDSKGKQQQHKGGGDA